MPHLDYYPTVLMRTLHLDVALLNAHLKEPWNRICSPAFARFADL